MGAAKLAATATKTSPAEQVCISKVLNASDVKNLMKQCTVDCSEFDRECQHPTVLNKK
jgi:hypothetical protein